VPLPVKSVVKWYVENCKIQQIRRTGHGVDFSRKPLNIYSIVFPKQYSEFNVNTLSYLEKNEVYVDLFVTVAVCCGISAKVLLKQQ